GPSISRRPRGGGYIPPPRPAHHSTREPHVEPTDTGGILPQMRKLSDKRKAPSRLSAHRAIQLKARGFLLSLMVFAAAQNAAAQGGGAALVDPSSKLYQATGGETVSGTVNVSNPGNSPLNLRLY